MFLAPNITRAANRHVTEGPEDRNPTFRRTAAGLVDVGGAILRYSTTTPDGGTPKPKPVKRAAARAALSQIAKATHAHD